MELKEKIRRIEEVVKLNNLYVREIWKCLKIFVKNQGINAGAITKIIEVLTNQLDIEFVEESKDLKINKKELNRLYL